MANSTLEVKVAEDVQAHGDMMTAQVSAPSATARFRATTGVGAMARSWS
jgi:hypothetical protein